MTANPMAHVPTIALITNQIFICFIVPLRLLLFARTQSAFHRPKPGISRMPQSGLGLVSADALRRVCLSKPTRKNQYDQNRDHHSKPAARVVTPVLTVRPGGQCAHEKKNEQY